MVLLPLPNTGAQMLRYLQVQGEREELEERRNCLLPVPINYHRHKCTHQLGLRGAVVPFSLIHTYIAISDTQLSR